MVSSSPCHFDLICFLLFFMPSTCLYVEYRNGFVELVRRPRGVISGLDLRLDLTSTPVSNLSSFTKAKLFFLLQLPPINCWSFNSFIQFNSIPNIQPNADTMPSINQASPPPHPSLPPAKAVSKACWSCFLTEENQDQKPFDEVTPHILAVLDYQKSKHNPDVRVLHPNSPSPVSSFGFESANSDEWSSEARSSQNSLPELGISSITLISLILQLPTNIMLNPRNLSGLLTENTDEHASHFM